MTINEKRSALALHDALRLKLDANAFRAAARASRAKHGDARHDVVKVAATHASRSQIASWRQETAS